VPFTAYFAARRDYFDLAGHGASAIALVEIASRVRGSPADVPLERRKYISIESSNRTSSTAFPPVSQVTTTDGEQPDDSFDLIDVPAEMSPPPTATSQPSSIHPAGHRGHSDDLAAGSHSSSPASPTSPISIAANQTTPPLPRSSSPTSPLCTFDGGETAGPSGRSSRLRLESGQPDGNPKPTTGTAINQGHNTGNGADGTAALPPPTPMVGAHQESRFTFGGSGRTPPLPDLRAADFFR